jgi:hypothetical protein
MLQTLLFALTLAAPGAPPEVLGSSIGANDALEMEQLSVKRTLGGAQGQSSITDTVSNYVVGSGLVFTIDGLAKGTLPPPQGAFSVLTMVRTTYRPVKAAYPQFVGENLGELQCSIWLESDVKVAATAVGKLEAKLIDGDEMGKVLVRCVRRRQGEGVHLHLHGREPIR